MNNNIKTQKWLGRGWPLLVLCTFLLHCGGEAAKTPAVGEPAWDFSLKDLSQSKVSLEDLQQDGIVLVNFWATWCAPCKVELPALKALHSTYGDKGLVVVGISVEERQDMVQKFCRRNGIDYTVLLDSDAEVAKQYALVGYPATFILDREGKVLYRTLHKLEEEDEKEIKAILEAHLETDQT